MVITYLRHCAAHGETNKQCLLGQAPAVQEFADVWKRLALGPQRQSRKLRTLEWCLFEAFRDRELDFLQAARCVSIALDERDGRLLVKYAASNAQLQAMLPTSNNFSRVLSPVDGIVGFWPKAVHRVEFTQKCYSLGALGVPLFVFLPGMLKRTLSTHLVHSMVERTIDALPDPLSGLIECDPRDEFLAQGGA
jgi:hypothetical protein